MNDNLPGKMQWHMTKLVDYLHKQIGNPVMGMAVLHLVVKDTIARIRTKQGDAFAQNILNGFLAEFQAGGWIPVRSIDELRAINNDSAGLFFRSSGLITLDGDSQEVMDPPMFLRRADPVTLLVTMKLPAWFYPTNDLPNTQENP